MAKLDDIIHHTLTSLLVSGKIKPGAMVQLPIQYINALIDESTRVMLKEPTVLTVDAPTIIVGDIHGQYYDLLRIFENQGVPPDKSFVFLGDYVDRGKFGIEVMCLLMALKIKFPSKVVMLRGNHECGNITQMYGFYEECKRRYSIKLWRKFVDLFNALPFAALVGKRIFCVHAGISPDIDYIKQINDIKRPTTIPEDGPICDLVWSDPQPDGVGWQENDRGVSYMYGADCVERFLRMNDLELLVRAHQVVDDGYEFCHNRQCVTIFSAPSYCGDMDNAAAVMEVDKNLKCTIHALKATKTPKAPKAPKTSAVAKPRSSK